VLVCRRSYYEDTSLYAPKRLKMAIGLFQDWKEHGIVDVRKALAVSSNVFFYANGGGYEIFLGLV
jgi:cell division protein FtsI/penicillin-binding protein 2